MSRPAKHLEISLLDAAGVALDVDDCDRATLMGIVREALEASPRIADFLEGRRVEQVLLATEMDERTTVFEHHVSAAALGCPATYTLAQLRDGSGFISNARFVQVF